MLAPQPDIAAANATIAKIERAGTTWNRVN
jgi:hypothetical protein